MSKDDHWLNNSVVSRIARGPGFESRSGHDFFLPCDIWWLSVGSRQGQRASKSACFVVPPLFRADSGTNLIKRGENVKGRPLAQQLSCLTDSERPWVRVPVGPRFFPSLLHLVAQCGFAKRATSIKKCMFRCSSVVPSRFGDESN